MPRRRFAFVVPQPDSTMRKLAHWRRIGVNLDAEGSIPPLDEVQMLANQHVLVVLVRNLEEFHDDPVARTARMVPLILDCRRGADRVANENRLDESSSDRSRRTSRED